MSQKSGLHFAEKVYRLHQILQNKRLRFHSALTNTKKSLFKNVIGVYNISNSRLIECSLMKPVSMYLLRFETL